MSAGLPGAIELPITEVAGLPLHPLVVHAVVVLVPLAAIGLIVMATSGKRSKRYSPAVLLVSFLGVISAFLAMLSGQALKAGPRRSDHFEWGEYVPWAALALFAIVATLALLDRQSGGKRNALGTLLGILGIVVSVATIALVVAVGHTGAELVWG